jgi:predicted regulator of Ras-like GTPase activity (Roadblock/LC7/MglB family)
MSRETGTCAKGVETVDASGESSFEQILREMNEEGRFKASVLLSAEGLPLSAASSPFDAETISAMVALLRNTVEQARKSIGLDEVDEVSIVQADSMRLICRCFTLGDEELTLSVIAPPHQTYRRLTNRAISRIKRSWKRLPGGRNR